jgi:hypothetical protein
MRFFEFATAVTAIGCGTGVIISTVDRVFSTRRQKPVATEAPSKDQSRDRQRRLEAEVATLRRQNDLLQKELDWHARLLEQGRPERPGQLGQYGRREPLPGRR